VAKSFPSREKQIEKVQKALKGVCMSDLQFCRAISGKSEP
jgi:hypothetical protein